MFSVVLIVDSFSPSGSRLIIKPRGGRPDLIATSAVQRQQLCRPVICGHGTIPRPVGETLSLPTRPAADVECRLAPEVLGRVCDHVLMGREGHHPRLMAVSACALKVKAALGSMTAGSDQFSVQSRAPTG